jgi:MinD-like ATPase involved in chromosome partitioning or flagellar assembly
MEEKTGKGKVIVGVSPRAGVGATTTLLNFAYFSPPNMNTIYVDLDILNPGGTDLLELERERNILDYFKDNNTEYIYEVENFSVMPLYLRRAVDMEEYLMQERELSERILSQVEKLRESYDLIFVDTMPGYSYTTIKVWQRFDELIGICDYNVQSISSLLQVRDIFREWFNRGLERYFKGIIVIDTKSNKQVKEKIMREIFENTPIYEIPFTKEFQDSNIISKDDTFYKYSLKNVLKKLGISEEG